MHAALVSTIDYPGIVYTRVSRAGVVACVWLVRELQDQSKRESINSVENIHILGAKTATSLIE